MTQPRRILEGTTWLVTRRCLERRYFLRPDAFVAEVLLYVLGFAVSLFGLRIVGMVALSNHLHMVVYDPIGRICAFFERAHLLIARALNCLRGRWGPFWEPGRLSLVELITPDDSQPRPRVVDSSVFSEGYGGPPKKTGNTWLLQPITSAMTQPRRIREGTTWLVPRRCLERRYFLRPDAFVAEVLRRSVGAPATL